MNDPWTFLRDTQPIWSIAIGFLAAAAGVFLSADWREHIGDRQYLVVLALCVMCLLAGGILIVRSAVEVTT